MRRKIITELANEYGKDEIEVTNILEQNVVITPYVRKQIKNRIVIDKSKINLEEQIVLDYYKLLLNKYCNIKFPNRSYIMAEIMNIIPYLHRYHSYTIYKFDFKDFFNTVSSKISFEYICEALELKTYEYNFLKNYTSEVAELTPGVGLHNTLVETSGEIFDLEIKKAFKESCLYYARYVDDCILILDEIVVRDKIEKIIFKLMNQCFGNKVKINNAKTDYYNSLCPSIRFDYLGYDFQKGQSAEFKFGIAKNKLQKYTDIINDIVLEYKGSNNIEVLSFKLELFFKRIVFYGTRKNNNRYRWQVRGISDSYKELKRFMKNNKDFTKITRDTENFFTRTIERSFSINRVTIPAKIKNQVKNNKFTSCFINNKSLLLHQNIGLNHNSLKERLKIVYNRNLENYSYSELANKLLSLIK